MPSLLRGKENNMKSSIYIDPKIDLNSEEYVEIIIQFKTRPAKTQLSIEPIQTLEKATQLVEESHCRFQQDLDNYLDKSHVSYIILNHYKSSFNGVAMEIIGSNIRFLLQSNEIDAIYINRKLNIPIKPSDPRYQI